MAVVFPRKAGFVCHSCQFSQSLKSHLRPLSITAFIDRNPPRRSRPQLFRQSNLRQDGVRSVSTAIPTLNARSTSKHVKSSRKPASEPEALPPHESAAHPAEVLASLQRDVASIRSINRVPDELEVLQLLDRLYKFANIIVFGQPETPEESGLASTSEDTVASTLQDLEDSGVKRIDVSRIEGLSLSFRSKAADTICEILYKFVKDPKVFISPAVLQGYTRIQCLLGRPEYLPEIFHLYAHKPIPMAKTSPIKYSNSWANSPKNAIPLQLSDAALEAAIRKKDLSLALAVIDTTVATSAFRRNKLLRDATVPFIFVGALPVLAWVGADWLSKWQVVWDEGMSKYTAMAGALAYIGTMTTIGYIAVTTWNDHHERVVWQVGTPLRWRWLKEEERLYFDRVAMAWGFQKKLRRGEEQGEEWEKLREIVAMRSMVLDKPELMEGME